MRFDKFTQKAQESIQAAESEAGKLNHSSIEPVHVLTTLLQQNDGIIPPLMERIGVSPREVDGEARNLLDRLAVLDEVLHRSHHQPVSHSEFEHRLTPCHRAIVIRDEY